MNMQELGIYISKLRTKKDLTQEMLADYVGVSRQAVSNWERGKAIPDVDVLPTLAKELGTTLEDLLSHVLGDKEINNIEDLKKKRVRIKKEEKAKAEKEEQKDKEKNEITPIINKIDVHNIMLNLYADAYKSKYEGKRYLLLFLLSSLILVICIATFIIFSLTNAVSIYNINGESDIIDVSNGLFVITRDKIYFDLGTINNKTDQLIKDIELYYYDKDDNRALIFREEEFNNDKNVIIHEYIGYDEYFKYKELNYMLNSITLELTLEDESMETVSLVVKKEKFSKLFSKKVDSIGDGEYSTIEMLGETSELENFVKENFTPEGDGYRYSLEYEGNLIEYLYLDKSISIDITANDELIEYFDYYQTHKYLYHKKYENKKIIIDESFDLKKENQENQEIINEFCKFFDLIKSDLAP